MYFRPAEAFERKSTVCGLNSGLPRPINSRGTCHFNPLPVSFLAALAPSVLLPRAAMLALRFRFKKYAQHTFSTKTERRKNSGSSQSIASLLRLTEPTNQSTNMSTALNNNSTRSRVPGTVAISDDEMRRFAPSVFASQPIPPYGPDCMIQSVIARRKGESLHLICRAIVQKAGCHRPKMRASFDL